MDDTDPDTAWTRVATSEVALATVADFGPLAPAIQLPSATARREPVPLPPDLASGLHAAADAHLADLRPDNTVRAYAADWQSWQQWCSTVAGVSPLTVDSALLVAYTHWCWHDRQWSQATTSRRLTGVIAGWRAELGFDAVPRGITARARRALAAYVRNGAADRQPRRGRGQAAEVDVPSLLRMLEACRLDPGPAGARDASLIIVSFGSGCRSAEAAGLLVDDIEVVDDRGLWVDIRASKVSSSIRRVALPRGIRAATDPLTAWQDWMSTAPAEPDDPAWCRIRRGGCIVREAGLSAESVSDIVARRAVQAGLSRRTCHGLRAGMATAAQASDAAVSAQGGWAPGSRAMAGYRRRGDAWLDNATRGLL